MPPTVEDKSIVEDDFVVEGTISARVERGMLVTMQDGSSGFLPASQVDVRPVQDLDSFIGQRHRFRVIKFKKGGSKVLSRRVLLEAERAALKAETLARLAKGQIVEGVVSAVVAYGAFVDLGGVDGLLRTDDAMWEARPSLEPFQVGDRIRVTVSELNPETERIGLTFVARLDPMGADG